MARGHVIVHALEGIILTSWGTCCGNSCWSIPSCLGVWWRRMKGYAKSWQIAQKTGSDLLTRCLKQKAGRKGVWRCPTAATVVSASSPCHDLCTDLTRASVFSLSRTDLQCRKWSIIKRKLELSLERQQLW
jgi:hypothetical protein